MPAPTTTGGGSMGYPTTVDTGQTIPWAMLPDDRTHWTTTGITPTQNATYIMVSTLTANVTLTGFRYRMATGGNGNCDIGLYDSSGNRVTHTGSTATVTGIRTTNLGTSVPVAPGKYYLAFWIDNVTDVIRGSNTSTGTVMASYTATGAGGLPATITPPLGTTDGTALDIIGLLSGGWS